MPATTDGSAVLRVVVTTALGALPLADAAVTVSTPADQDGARTLLYAVRTDASGMTPPLTLATPPRANSMTPDGGTPYAVYTVEATHPGYLPRTALHIAMFPGIPAVLPVALIPLGETGASASPGLTAAESPQALYHNEPSGEE
ncbi:hypothetical protein [Agathobaculum desmolans]|uniref:hypothetical protein n=1 Tax=Agathobaculum desmolans TaxID=39484 RepID=UPI0004E1C101|nr:hypothetical protein [Agathobaculum desmolans]